jgi:hypothetical protein
MSAIKAFTCGVSKPYFILSILCHRCWEVGDIRSPREKLYTILYSYIMLLQKILKPIKLYPLHGRRFNLFRGLF